MCILSVSLQGFAVSWTRRYTESNLSVFKMHVLSYSPFRNAVGVLNMHTHKHTHIYIYFLISWAVSTSSGKNVYFLYICVSRSCCCICSFIPSFLFSHSPLTFACTCQCCCPKTAPTQSGWTKAGQLSESIPESAARPLPESCDSHSSSFPLPRGQASSSSVRRNDPSVWHAQNPKSPHFGV